jgi:Copper chaperone
MTIRNQKFQIDGMSDSEHAQSIARTLQALPGIGEVAISLETACATIQFEDGQLSADKIIAAIECEGLDVRETVERK